MAQREPDPRALVLERKGVMEELRIQHHPEKGKFLSESAEEEAY